MGAILRKCVLVLYCPAAGTDTVTIVTQTEAHKVCGSEEILLEFFDGVLGEGTSNDGIKVSVTRKDGSAEVCGEVP